MRSAIRGVVAFTLLLMTGNVRATSDDKALLARLQQCQQEAAPLLRLDCYDHTLTGKEPAALTAQEMRGAAWQRAMSHERQRSDHSTGFLVTNSGGENPQVVLTTPATGIVPPRPVLILSCVDNITRLQVALTTPVSKTEGTVTLTTEQTRFNADWFVREHGFLLESSRGLAGIDEIKRLFAAQSLTLTLPHATQRVVFNITGLAQSIEPLRDACHW